MVFRAQRLRLSVALVCCLPGSSSLLLCPHRELHLSSHVTVKSPVGLIHGLTRRSWENEEEIRSLPEGGKLHPFLGVQIAAYKLDSLSAGLKWCVLTAPGTASQ